MKRFELGIVIPTYNEKDNIADLLIELKKVCTSHSIHTVVLVVDDNSPDGTAKAVQTLIDHICTDKFEIRMLNRAGKMGLASAYMQGFSLLRPEVDNLMSMDADHSHQPKYIPEFVRKAREGYAFVIGSRYVEGGNVENWAIFRQMLSKGGALYSRALLNLNIHDFTGGFNLYKSTIFETVNINGIKAEGYMFQIEMKYKVVKSGFKYIEIPIIFPDRTKGSSKITKRIIAEAILGVVRLRFRGNKG